MPKILSVRFATTLFHRASHVGILAVWIAFSLLPDPAQAQVLFGTIVGDVTDATGAAVAGATVRVTELRTGDSRTAQSNEAGVYTISTVSAGTYRVDILKEGFKGFETTNIEVRQGDAVRVDAQLQLGAQSEKVEVTSDVAALQTDRADVHTAISSQNLLDLPQPTRTYQGLLEMVPGMSPPGGILLGGTNNPSKTMEFSANGGGYYSVAVRIEGVSAQNAWGSGATSSFAPSVEAIASVNVVTSSPDAEQGMGGTSVLVQLKSGSNQLHGAAFLYNVDSSFEANNFFSVSSKPPHLVNNTAGGSIGGHVIKDKLFYFGSYDGDFTHQAIPLLVSVPTPAMLGGDFSGAPNIIYQPNTGTATGAGKTPFPGNLIPKSMISPQLATIIPIVPAPNLPGVLNNYNSLFGTLYNLHRWDTKVDYNATSKLRVSGRFGYQPYYNFQNPPFGQVLGGGALGGVGSLTNTTSPLQHGATEAISVAATYVASPTFIIDTTYGITQQHEFQVPVHAGVNYGLDVMHIPGTNQGSLPYSEGMPQFNITNYGAEFGENNPYITYLDPVFEYNVNATKIKGKHNVRFGADIIKIDMNHNESNTTSFSFTGGVTALNGGTAPNQYNAVADFILGLPTSFTNSEQFTLPHQTMRVWDIGLYAKDQWQITRKLTLNYGIRWEFYPVPTQAGKGINFYDFATNELQECGVGGVPGDCGIKVSKKLFTPKIGVAYRAFDKMVVRAGFAISPLQMNMTRNQISAYPDVITNTYNSANSYVQVGSLTTGIPVIVPPTITNGNLKVPAGTGNLITDPQNFKRGYIESWNLTVQREFRGGFLGSVGYVGSHNVDLFGEENVNYGQLGGGSASQPFFPLGITGSVFEFLPFGSAHYNSLQGSVLKRFENGLMIQGAYTWSHEIGLCCGGEETAPSILIPQYQKLAVATMPLDRTQNLHLASTYELPFGKGKAYLQHGLVAAVTGGWSLNGLFSHVSGTPFSVGASSASCNCPGNTQRANQLLPKVAITGSGVNGTSYFNPLAFANVTTPTFGTAGFDTLRGPGHTNLDLSVFRTFSLTERFRVQIRAEALNASNTPHFSNPGASVSSLTLNPDGSVKSLGGFGQITSTTALGRVVDQRYFRFGFRIMF
jgi:hypothetical protein